MSNILEVTLKYTDNKGKDCSRTVKIKKIFNWATEEYDRINDIIKDVQEKVMDIAEIETMIDTEDIRKSVIIKDIGKAQDLSDVTISDDWFQKRKDLRSKRKDLLKELKEIRKSSIFKDRFNLISGILKDNAIHTEEFHTYKFWDRQVEPQEITKFLLKAISKDYVQGEKQTGGKSTSLV